MIGTGDDHRSVLTHAVVPPDGMSLDAAVVCTYSLSLPTLLTLPAHVVLKDESSRSELLENPVALLDALRKASDRLDVFLDAGSMHAPRSTHLLYGLLEPMIHEVMLGTPDSGFHATKSFHPKLWVLRFVSEDPARPPHMRMLVGSRNLTGDRSWDLCLRLEGTEQEQVQPTNTAVRDLLHRLAGSVARDAVRRQRVEALAEAVGRTEWQVPPPFEALSFAVLGLTGKRWLPRFESGTSRRLVVVSPFLDAGSLDALRKTTREATALVSSPAELARVPAATLAGFEQVKVLAEYAETEDGDDAGSGLERLQGLHAKLYLMQRGNRVRIAVGSANATPRALLRADNVEVMAVLEGAAGLCGTPDQLLDAEQGMGEVLADFVPPETLPETDTAATQALEGLESLKARIARHSALRLVNEAHPAGGWVLALTPEAPVDLREATRVECWPVTISSDQKVDAAALAEGRPVSMRVLSTALLTGLVAFELTHPDAPHVLRFALNLEVEGLPEDRHARVMEAVLQSPDGFLRYLRYLLGELSVGDVSEGGGGGDAGWAKALGLGGDALLESLTRALARQPSRLEPVRDLVDHLRKSDEGRAILPDDFLQIWSAFEPHLPPPAEVD